METISGQGPSSCGLPQHTTRIRITDVKPNCNCHLFVFWFSLESDKFMTGTCLFSHQWLETGSSDSRPPKRCSQWPTRWPRKWPLQMGATRNRSFSGCTYSLSQTLYLGFEGNINSSLSQTWFLKLGTHFRAWGTQAASSKSQIISPHKARNWELQLSGKKMMVASLRRVETRLSLIYSPVIPLLLLDRSWFI